LTYDNKGSGLRLPENGLSKATIKNTTFGGQSVPIKKVGGWMTDGHGEFNPVPK
jgi:hypothetical protein